jgi:hypothetical protein
MKSKIIRTAMVGQRNIGKFHDGLEDVIEQMQHCEDVHNIEIQYQIKDGYFSALVLGRMERDEL